MIISRRLRFAFFRIPKTGSTTAEAMLRLSGALDSDDVLTPLPSLGLPERNIRHIDFEIARRHFTSDAKRTQSTDIEKKYLLAGMLIHMTPQHAIDQGLVSLDELSSMNCFAFVRDPAERYLSAYRHSLNGQATPRSFRDHLASEPPLPIFGAPQVDYLWAGGIQVVTPLPFDRFSANLAWLIRSIGGFVGNEIPQFKAMRAGVHGHKSSDWYDRDALQTIRERYVEDYAVCDRLRESRPADFHRLEK